MAYSGKTAGIVKQNPVNNPIPAHRVGYSNYILSHQHLTTQQFGTIQPFFFHDGVLDDQLDYSNSHELRTYTLASPLMQKVRLNKAVFEVPLKCIMPHSWDKYYQMQRFGDDLPAAYNPTIHVTRYNSGILDLFRYLFVSPDTFPHEQACLLYIYSLIFSYHIGCRGSLLDNLGCVLRFCFESESKEIDFDAIFDGLYERMHSVSTETPITLRLELKAYDGQDVGQYNRNLLFNFQTDSFEDFREKFQLLVWHNGVIRTSQYAQNLNFFQELAAWLGELYDTTKNLVCFNAHDINLTRLYAYQALCAQFFSQDSVDPIFCCEYYIQNQESIAYKYISFKSTSVNGLNVQYDAISNYCNTELVSKWILASSVTSVTDIATFFLNIFRMNRNLRYGDYFMSARLQPSAVTGISTGVVSDKVDALDMTRSLLLQRLATAVNKLPQHIDDYLRGVFGNNRKERDYRPMLLTSENFSISGFEVENTSDDQGNVTTNLMSQNSNYRFYTQIDDDCSIIMGVSYFDIKQVYKNAIDRFFFHEDKYDMFNPMLQGYGDQDISVTELSGVGDCSTAFGYGVRNLEYKERYSIACGGFYKSLPTWSFAYKPNATNPINMEVIRYLPKDFDPFYKSLTGVGLGTYFHFIIRFDNDFSCKRRIDPQPDALF